MAAKGLVVSILNDLVRAASVDLPATIDQALRRLGEFAGVDRAYIFTLRDGALLDNTHEWVAPGVVPMLAELQGLPLAIITPWRAAFDHDAPVHIPSVGDLPDTSPEKPTLQMQGIRSLLAAPMLESGRLSGFIGFDVTREARVFPEDQITLLTSAAVAIQGALQRSATEARLRATASQLEATLAALPDLLFEVDADGRYTGFVAGPRELMAAPPEVLRGQRPEDILPPDLGPMLRLAFEQVITTGTTRGLRYALDLPVGRRWFELSGARKDAVQPGGRPSALFLVRDVTEDSILRNELLRLGKIVETMSNLVAVLDTERRILWVNAAFERQTGWTLPEIRGQVLGDLVRCPDSDPDVSRRLTEAIAARVMFHGETINQDRHGHRYWIDFNMIPLHAQDGGLQGFVSVETVITHQKEQEETLARLAVTANDARLRLENALDALQDGVVVLGADERILVVNRAYHQSMPLLVDLAVEGTLLEDLLRAGATRGVFNAGSTPEEQEDWLQKRLAQYRLPQFIDEAQMADGRWIRRINNRTADGGCIAVGIDVTARNNQMAALDAANRELTRALADRDRTEHRMLGIIEGAAVGTWEWDITTGQTTVGDYWLAMLGHEHDLTNALSIDEFRALVHPEDQLRLDAWRAKDEQTGSGIIEHEFRMWHKTRGWIWVLSRSRVILRLPDGAPAAIAGVNLDIDERRRLQQDLEAGRVFLDRVMQTSMTAMCVLDAEGVIVLSNHEAEAVLGRPRSDIEGRTYSDPIWRLETVAGGPMAESDLPFQRAVASTDPVRDILFAVHWPDGTRRVLSASSARLGGDDGPLQVVVSFSDVTEQLALNARLEESRLRAEEASRAKSVFLANMSHEIRTPLNGVLGMTEVLESQLTLPEHKRLIGTIRTSGETLLMVLNGILDMSKIEAGKMVLDTVPFIPADVLRHTEAVFTVLAEEKGLSFEAMTTPGSENPRMGDPHRIQQVLNNLLQNAVKFTERGEVAVKLSCRPGKPMVIEVTDSGLGMTEAQLARVFDSFEQADGSVTRRFGGTGLGLSIVKELVALMGGELTLDSAPGQGTRARVTLPLAETAAPAPPVDAIRRRDLADDSLRLSGRRVLIADDNATNRLVLREMLAASGAAITLVENGQEAVDAFTAAQGDAAGFDMLLLDITMPVMDGLTAMAEIRRLEAAARADPVPAIAVTANAMPHQVADYILGGFDSHLAKPFKHRDLVQAIRVLIER